MNAPQQHAGETIETQFDFLYGDDSPQSLGRMGLPAVTTLVS